MVEDVVIEMMTEDFILWHCLHGGPLSRSTIDQSISADDMSWGRYCKRNTRLLEKLTRKYGARGTEQSIFS